MSRSAPFEQQNADDPMPDPSARDESLAEIVAALRGILAEGNGTPSERALAERLNVKRHRLRRALDQLRAAGELAPARTGRPRTAPARRGDDLARDTNPVEIIELRMMLEPALARLAALRASPFEITRIQRAASTPPGASAGAVDLAFHKAVAAGARNSLATELYALIRQVATDARLRFSNSDNPSCPNRLRQRDAEHKAIADAIAARDPDAAEQAMRAHLGAVQRQILDRLGPGMAVA
jgi:DNA-binding FadR family transcriptional regulator